MSFWTDIRDAFEGVVQGLTAPIWLGADLVQGKNVLHSVEYRGLQAIGGQGGGSGLMVAADSSVAQKIGSTLNDYTFGLSGSIIQGAGYGGEAVMSRELTDSELFAAYRGIGETAGIAGASVALAGAGEAAFVPSTTQTAIGAGVSKFSRTGDASALIAGVGGALGGDPDIVSGIADYYAPHQPPSPEIGAGNFVPRIQLKTPQSSVLVDSSQSSALVPIILLGGAAVILLTMKRR